MEYQNRFGPVNFVVAFDGPETLLVCERLVVVTQRETHNSVVNVGATHICCDGKKIESVVHRILVFLWVEDRQQKVECAVLPQNHEMFDHDDCPNCVVVVSLLHWVKQKLKLLWKRTADTRNDDSLFL